MILDANVVLRYFLDDIPELTEKSAQYIEKENIYIPFEVVAEVVFVLFKIYKINQEKICGLIRQLFEYPNISTNHPEILDAALDTFQKTNLSFIDCLLVGYQLKQKGKVITFDKELKKYLDKIKS